MGLARRRSTPGSPHLERGTSCTYRCLCTATKSASLCFCPALLTPSGKRHLLFSTRFFSPPSFFVDRRRKDSIFLVRLVCPPPLIPIYRPQGIDRETQEGLDHLSQLSSLPRRLTAHSMHQRTDLPGLAPQTIPSDLLAGLSLAGKAGQTLHWSQCHENKSAARALPAAQVHERCGATAVSVLCCQIAPVKASWNSIEERTKGRGWAETNLVIF